MVGRFIRSNKQAAQSSDSDHLAGAPPAYSESAQPALLVASETTTTVVTTTHTTTHFFSLPLWTRKRTTSGAPPARHSSFGGGGAPAPTEDGVIRPNSMFMHDKDLPPTPPREYSQQESIMPAAEQPFAASATLPPITTTTNSAMSSECSASQPSSTAALAQAALGLGLPHVMPKASPSRPSAEVNSVAFNTPPPPIPESPPQNVVRRVKSSGKIRATSTTEAELSRRRTRGLSLNLFGNGDSSPSPSVKGKEKDREHTPDSPKPLTRRASFWNRKKSLTPTDMPVPPLPTSSSKDNLLPKPQLPSLRPISPFGIGPSQSGSGNMASSSSSLSVGMHQRALSRSHSERVPSRPATSAGTTAEPSSSASGPRLLSPPKRRQQKRPMTADGEARYKTSSTFIDSDGPMTASPPASPVLPTSSPRHLSPSAPASEEEVPAARPRANTNPPILQRLSMTLFPSSVPSFPNISSTSGNSPANSPRPSLTRVRRKPSVEIPKPRTDEESPELYLQRLSEVISKAEIATVLASSASSFHIQALRAYLSQFDFTDDPLDVALRKLLMDVGLPRETQQIDRVIEGFANRYVTCNPNLFISNDNTYVLAFSLIMLHTDAFNKSNKRKMTKPDYIRNTRLPGVAPEILDCFYDNIVFAPFIFIEDPVDVNGQRSMIPEVPSSRTLSSLAGNSSVGNINNGSTSMFSANRVDPYYLIARNQLGHLRIDIGSIIPFRSPYRYQGTAGAWDADELHRVFAQAGLIEVGAVDPPALQRVNPFFGMAAGAAPAPMMATPLGEISMSPPQEKIYTLKLTKVGLLNRKDDLLEGGRKAMNRKWRTWSVMLTGSQLFFFRDASWAETLRDYAEVGNTDPLLPPPSVNQPDEWVSVKDAVAVFDTSYTRHENTFRFLLPDGRHYLLQAPDERELNEWISRINYASAFKTAGVRMRPMGMSSNEVQLTGVAAATSHLHDMQAAAKGSMHSPRVHKFSEPQTPPASDEMEQAEDEEDVESQERTPSRRKMTVLSGRSDDAPMAPEVDGADQFKATFDQVKADLAAGILHNADTGESRPRTRLVRSDTCSSLPTSPGSPKFAQMEMSRLPGRSQVIQSKVHEIKEKLAATQTQLEADLRFARNLGIMTPFQRSTRDRLLHAAHALAPRVSLLRLEVAKLVCHREVLASDLIAESRDWYRSKALALKAATETLQSRRPDTAHSAKQQHVPTLGFSNESTQSLPPEPSISSAPPSALHTPGSPGRRRPPSSICESFHSALDYSLDWPTSPAEAGPVSMLAASRPSVSPRHSSSGSVQSFDGPPSSVERTPSSGIPSSHDGRPSHSPGDSQDFAHDKFYTALEATSDEEAEEWNKTRCAKRVSLVRLPSTFNLSSRFERMQGGEALHEEPGAPSSASPG